MSALLHARPSEYEGGLGKKATAPYKVGSVSLPEASGASPFLETVLPSDARNLLCEFETHMLRGVSELLELRDHAPVLAPHMDPVLAKDHGKYVGFVRELFGKGVLQWTTRPAEFVGLFFVPKKDGKIRLIVDARLSNQHFRNPPGVVMAGPEVFANLEVPDGSNVWCAETDIKDCFYRLRIGEDYGRYFSLPGVTAKSFGVTHVQGRAVSPSDVIFPCLAVLPMGHTWSLYFAQRVSEHQVGGTEVLSKSPPLRGDGMSVALTPESPVTFFVYVDNIGVIGTDEKLVNRAISEAAAQLEKVGLRCHAPLAASHQIETLGVEFDAATKGFRPTNKRYWRIKRTLSYFLRTRRASGKQLEILMGHLTYFSMLYRGALCIFNSVYKFIRRNYEVRSVLWDEVLNELWVYQSLMPLIRSH